MGRELIKTNHTVEILFWGGRGQLYLNAGIARDKAMWVWAGRWGECKIPIQRWASKSGRWFLLFFTLEHISVYFILIFHQI